MPVEPAKREREILLQKIKDHMKLPQQIECKGQVKICGYTIGGFAWKTGRLSIECDNGVWKGSVYYDVNKSKSPAIQFCLSNNNIERVLCKSYLILTTKKGISYYLKGNLKGEMDRIAEVLTEIKNGTARSEIVDKATVKATTPLFNSSPSPRKKSPSKISPHIFTRMKENRRDGGLSTVTEDDKAKKIKARENLFDFAEDNEEKENHTTPHRLSDKNGFLQKGADKSRETLMSIGTGGFYSKSFGAQLSDSSDPRFIKRSPALMPDPTPTKRQRLSDNTYSLQNRKSENEINTNSKPQALHGFSNLGNTCYMNAILQSLFALDTFTTDLVFEYQKITRHMSKQSLYFALEKLLRSRKKIHVPELCRRELLKNVKSAISTSAKRFSGDQQHDAHEFLEQVLDQLKEEVIKINKSTPSPSHNSYPSDSQQQSSYLNPTVQNFEFEVQHTITCLGCHEEITKLEQFYDLSLDIPQKRTSDTPHSVQDAFDYFFRNESIEYKCEKCDGLKAEVTHHFTRLPRILILHLKRYSYDISGSSNRKIGQTLDIPRYLTFQSHCQETTSPPFPALNIYTVSHSSEPDNGEAADGSSKRKLDYSESKFNFKRTRDGDAHDSSDKDDSITRADSPKLTSLKSPVDVDCASKYSEHDDETDLAKALELSLQESNKKLKVVHERYGEDKDSSSYINQLEATDKAGMCDPYKDTAFAKWSEQDLIDMAIENSLMESYTSTPAKSHFLELNSDSETKSVIKDCSNAVLNSFSHNRDKRDSSTENGLSGGYDKHNSSFSCKAAQLRSDKESEKYQSICISSEEDDIDQEVELPTIKVMSSKKKCVKETSPKSERTVRQSSESELRNYEDSQTALNSFNVKPQSECIVLDSESDETDASFTETRFPNSKQPYKCDIKDIKKESDLFISDASADNGQNCEKLTDETPKSPSEISFSPLKEIYNLDSPNASVIDDKPKKSVEKSLNSCVIKLQRTSFGAVKALSFMTEESKKTEQNTHSSKSSAIEKLCQSVEGDDDLVCKEDDLFLMDDKENTAPEDHSHSERNNPTDDIFSDHPSEENDIVYFEPQNIENENGDLPYSYRLISVVNHIGTSSALGHYVSDVCDLKTKSWYSCDDSHVSSVSEEDVRKKRKKSGYIFFFLNKEIYEDLESHYLISKKT